MVEADLVDDYPPGLDPEQTREQALEGDGDVAEADRAVPGVEQRPRHDPDRVGEIDDPCARSRPLRDPLGDLEHDRDRAERLREAAGPGRLLADAAGLQRDRLVGEPCGLAAYADLQEHEVGGVERAIQVAGEHQLARETLAGEHPSGQTADHAEALGVDVMEGQLADVEAFAQQARDELGRVRRAAADDRDLHPFTPVRVMPSTKTFCARKKMTITGSMTSTVAAMVRFHCTWCRLRNCDRPMDTGQLCRSPWPT